VELLAGEGEGTRDGLAGPDLDKVLGASKVCSQAHAQDQRQSNKVPFSIHSFLLSSLIKVWPLSSVSTGTVELTADRMPSMGSDSMPNV